jgi:thiol:disulfide interchange protein DsbD
MLNYVRFFLILMMGCVLPFQAFAFGDGSSHVKVELIQEEETVQPSRPFWVALHLKLDKDWHVYWKNPGDAGIPLKIEWKLPEGFEAGPLQWPFPEKFSVADMVGFGYKEEVTLLSQITPPAQLDPQIKKEVEAQVKWLVCSSLNCQPGSVTVTLPLTFSTEPPRVRTDLAAIFEQARAKIPQTHVEVKTIRKHGIVQLEVPQETTTAQAEIIRGVYFFPEQKDIIDHSIEPTVAASVGESNRYLVNLKGSDEIGAESRFLKGVLVLHTQKGVQENIQAFDIDSPIEEGSDQEVLSLMTPSSTHSSSLAIGNPTIQSTAPASLAFEGGVGLALIFAFMGGLLLNLMPCVLPVMSFKVMSFVKMAGQSRSLTLKHGLMFSLGVILSFWILASAMLMLRAYGQAVGWGFQLQEPLFVVILASLLFIFALSLFGVFEWGMFFASWAGQTEADSTQKSSGYMGSFLSGVLATAVATPCTGPFLGSAIGFAVTLPLFQSLLIFTSLGLGMCFPYLLLAAFPSYLRFIPKPGAWMEIFKQLMGFLLLATVLWLMWVFSAQTDTFSLICLLAGLLCFAIGAWIYGRGCSPVAKRSTRVFAYAFVLFFAFIGCQAILLPRASWYSQDASSHTKSSGGQWEGWETFSPERVAQLRREGKPILIDFTAKWCLICQANHLILSSEDIKKQLDDLGVIKMKADWTKNDPIITQELSKFGRNSVPLYILYGPDEKQEPLILPQVLTPDVIAEHLNKVIPEEIALK